MMQIKNGEFWLGDCLELMKEIPDGSVDMILCDLPYGTTQNKWDTVIPFEPLWEQYWRVAKPNAAIVLTAQTPFDKILGTSQIEFLKYEWIWNKMRGTGHLNAKKQPMKSHENCLVFYQKQCVYNSQKSFGHLNYETSENSPSNNYGLVVGTKTSNTDGSRYPVTIQNFKIKKNPQHPTQKPVALFEYLIKTYTNEGETVLDNCAGSGTTAVAAEQTGRKWICIEQLPEYYYPAIMRVLQS